MRRLHCSRPNKRPMVEAETMAEAAVMGEDPQDRAVRFEYSQQEREIIQAIENAGYWRDMVNSRGWELFLQLKDKRIEQIKNQFFMTRMDKETTFVTQVRLVGIIEFVNALIEGINSAVESLDPEVLKRLLNSVVIDKAALDGDMNIRDI